MPSWHLFLILRHGLVRLRDSKALRWKGWEQTQMLLKSSALTYHRLQVLSSPHFWPVLSWLLIQSWLAAHHAAPASAARASPPHSATGRQLAWPQAVPPEWHGWQSPGSPRAPGERTPATITLQKYPKIRNTMRITCVESGPKSSRM